jgi:hypothetical protein
LQTPTGNYYGNDSEANYARNVDMWAGKFGQVSIGTITVNSSPVFTAAEHAAAIKAGVTAAITEHQRSLMLAFNGAYQ